MNLLLLCILSLYVTRTEQWQSQNKNRWNSFWNAWKASNRLLMIMRSYYEESHNRIAELNEQRFMYEESPQYEQGYIMGELIERYKKIVDLTQKSYKYKSNSLFDSLKWLELIQKHYFEIYHLVRMMHEIPQKYRSVLEFAVPGSQFSIQELQNAQKNIEDMQRRREKERRKRKKFNDKLRVLYLKGLAQTEYGKKKTPYNQWWPRDYGWEIDYWW